MLKTEVPKIHIDNLGMTYGAGNKRFTAIENVSLEVPQNSFVSIIGPSGCGKSSLLKVISKVAEPASGKVALDGQPLRDCDLRGQLSFMFQQPLLLPWRNVLDNVLLPLEIIEGRVSDDSRSRAEELIERVGLGAAKTKRPYQLSGGMRQRAALARALVMEPDILLMDEPFGAVDEITRASLQAKLLEIWQEKSTTIVLVTHQVEEAILLSDEIVVMSQSPGRIIERVKVDFERPRSTEVRSTPEFHALVDHLHSLLEHESGAGSVVSKETKAA